MKKLFSILAVALFALSAHATVVTQNLEGSFSAIDGNKTTLDGSSFTVSSGGWDGIQNWGWTTPQEGFNTLVLQVEGHSYPINVEVRHGDDQSFTKTMSATQTSLSIDITGLGTIKGLKVISATDQEATITINSFRLIKVLGKETTADIWSGSNDFGNWQHDFYIDGVVDAYEGDEIIVSYTKSSDPQCQIKERNTPGYLSFVGEYMDVTDDSQTSFLLNAADAEKVRTSGLVFNGKNMTITKVQLRHHNTLWTGSTEAGSWENAVTISASKLSDLQIGNIICVRVTDIGSAGSPRVSLFSGWSNSDALAGGEYYFKGEDAASAENPFIVQFPVTGSMKQQLGNKDLLIRGVNYTVTDVYVLEGEPVAEDGVKGYLTVSAAGMATFMLPFNVPSPLPDGVQAYNLTNNGDATIWAEEVTSLTADKPVLIIAAAGEYEFVSEAGASDDISGKIGTYTNGALVGTYTTIDPLAQQTGSAYNYILSNGSDGVAFYQVLDGSCSVAPYRAYLSCGYDASTPQAGMPPRKSMRIVFHQDTTTGVEDVQGDKLQCTKVFENGVLYIMNNGIKYNVQGQLCK